MAAAGDLYIDNISVVEGGIPETGLNLLQNGGFETGDLTGWRGRGNHSNSVVSSAAAFGGAYSLRLIASNIGSSGNLFEQTVPQLPSSTPHTFSFWYLPTTNCNGLNFRISTTFRSLSTIDFRPVRFTPGLANSVRSTLPEGVEA